MKSNLGHTESTAGLAGLIKSVLVLEKGVIPPNPNFKKHSEDLASMAADMQVLTLIITFGVPVIID